MLLGQLIGDPIISHLYSISFIKHNICVFENYCTEHKDGFCLLKFVANLEICVLFTQICGKPKNVFCLHKFVANTKYVSCLHKIAHSLDTVYVLCIESGITHKMCFVYVNLLTVWTLYEQSIDDF